VIGRVDIGGVVWVPWDSKIVIKGQGHFPFALDLVVVEVVQSCMRFDHRVDRPSISSSEQRFVERPPDGDTVREVRHYNLPIVHKRILKRHVLVRVLESRIHITDSSRPRNNEDIRKVSVELKRRVVMVEHDGGLHALLNHKVDEIIVMRQALPIHRCAWKCKGQDACPRDREPIVLDSHRSDAFNVMLVQIVVLNADKIVCGAGVYQI